MNEAWILIKAQHADAVEFIDEMDELIEMDENMKVMVFPSLDAASDYQETYGISGRCVELPLY